MAARGRSELNIFHSSSRGVFGRSEPDCVAQPLQLGVRGGINRQVEFHHQANCAQQPNGVLGQTHGAHAA